MCLFSKYKDALGKPNEGFHSTRFLGYALYDILGTILIGLLISKFFNLSVGKTILFLFLLGLLLHLMFGVNTKMVNQLGIHFKN